MRYRAPARGTDLRLTYSGLAIPTSPPYVELTLGGDYEVKVALCVISSGTTISGRIPVYFSGRRIGRVRGGSLLTSDPIPVDLAEGDEFYLYQWINRKASSSLATTGEYGTLEADQPYLPRAHEYLFGSSASWFNDCGVVDDNVGVADPFSLDTCDSGAFVFTSYAHQTRPAAITARILSPGRRSVAWIGDSITYGSGDIVTSADTYSGWGYAGRVSGKNVPCVRLGIGGLRGDYLTAAAWSYSWYHRLSLCSGADTAYVALGINDLASQTSTQVQATLTTLIEKLRDRGIPRIILATVSPRTTSTDGWATTANQTWDAATAERIKLNDWIRRSSPADYCFDLAAAVESTDNKWLAGSVAVSGTTAAASSTTVINVNETLVANAHMGRVLYVGGEAREIYSNTTGALTCSPAFSGAPGTAVAYTIVDAYTYDGLHPSPLGYRTIAAALTATGLI